MSATWSSWGLDRLLRETLLAFLRDQSREVKKSSPIISEQLGLVFTEDAGGAFQGSADLARLGLLWISIQNPRPRSGP